MSTNNRRHNLRYAFLLAPWLATCGGSGGGGASGTITLPAGGITFADCRDGQYFGVSADGKSTTCIDATGKQVSLPAQSCAANQALTSEDGQAWKCVDLPKGGSGENPLNVKLTEHDKKVDELSRTAENVKNRGGGGYGVYVGSTAAKYNGQLGAGAADSSLKVAADKCAAEFGAGARMCTAFDLFHSVATGKLTTATTVTQANRAWIWMPSWNTPAGLPGGAAREPLAGVSDTCGSYTYPTGDLAWAGVAFGWENAMTGRKALKFFGGTAARCSDNLAIACCK
jgi:hypothetical protein